MADQQGIARRSFLGGAAGLGLASGLMGMSVSYAAGKFHANVMTSSGSLSLVFGELMKQNKFFEQMDVDATPLPVSDGAKVIAALVGGGADMCGGAGFAGLFPAMEKGAKIKILSAAGLSPVTAIFTKNPAIKSVHDLVGKSVGTGAPGALLHELVVALCIKKGVDHTKITFVNVGSGPDVFRAVLSGTVDAGPSEIDFYYHQDKYGVRALEDGLMWNELPEFTNQAMFASHQAIAEKREALVRCMAAYCKMYRFVQTPAGEAAWRKARAVGLSKDEPEEAHTQWKFFQGPNRLATNLEMTKERTDYVQKLNVQLGVQQKVLPFEEIVDPTLARDALKLIGPA